MDWFKEAALSSYNVEIEYAMSSGSPLQVVSVVIKRNGNSYLQANVFNNGSTYVATLQIVIGGIRSTIAQTNLTGAQFADGFLRLQYDAVSRIALARIVTVGGGIFELSGVINENNSNALGQFSAIGISYSQILPVVIRSVTGGPI